jgi:hypothetical protein
MNHTNPSDGYILDLAMALRARAEEEEEESKLTDE